MKVAALYIAFIVACFALGAVLIGLAHLVGMSPGVAR